MNSSQLQHEVHTRLRGMLCTGESRDSNKHKRVSETGRIHSWSTYHAYDIWGRRLVKYCHEVYGCGSVDDCAEHLGQYIKHLQKEGASAYTQKLARSAAAKLYGRPFPEVQTDIRHRANIKRSRHDTESLRHFSKANNADLINLCMHTGLRREDVTRLQGGSVWYRDGQAYITVHRSKGGKDRNVPILSNDQRTIDLIQGTQEGRRVFHHIHSAAPIHEYRAAYALHLYQHYLQQMGMTDSKLQNINDPHKVYICRRDMAGVRFWKPAMLKTSQALGHGRIDVIAQSYLYDAADSIEALLKEQTKKEQGTDPGRIQ